MPSDLPARDVPDSPARHWLTFVAVFTAAVALLAVACAWTGRGVPL